MNIVCMHVSCASVHVLAGQNVFTWDCETKNVYPVYALYLWAMCVTSLGWINLVSVGFLHGLSQGSPLFRLRDAVGAEH